MADEVARYLSEVLARRVQTHQIATGHIMLTGTVEFVEHCHLGWQDGELIVLEEADVLKERIVDVECGECDMLFTLPGSAAASG